MKQRISANSCVLYTLQDLLMRKSCFLIVLVEKILRLQPNVKKMYLLLRASDDKSAMQRLRSEVWYKSNLVIKTLIYINLEVIH